MAFTAAEIERRREKIIEDVRRENVARRARQAVRADVYVADLIYRAPRHQHRNRAEEADMIADEIERRTATGEPLADDELSPSFYRAAGRYHRRVHEHGDDNPYMLGERRSKGR